MIATAFVAGLVIGFLIAIVTTTMDRKDLEKELRAQWQRERGG